MSVSPGIRSVFAHFQNLNLLFLLQDLRDGNTVRRAWFSSSLLCPVAHGLPTGQQVHELAALGQSVDLPVGCTFVARHLGASPEAVLSFVRFWDEAASADWLLSQLEELWQERLADAEAVQRFLQPLAVEEPA